MNVWAMRKEEEDVSAQKESAGDSTELYAIYSVPLSFSCYFSTNDLSLRSNDTIQEVTLLLQFSGL